jgi:putative addiction module component (TIGR02574 family)
MMTLGLPGGAVSMAITLQELGVDRLSVEDRLELARQIWESVAAELEQQPLTEAQRRELERRLAAADAHPDEGIAWETVKAEALARSRK